MCEFCSNQRATNRPATNSRLRTAVNALDTTLRGLGQRVEQLAEKSRPAALAVEVADVTRQVDTLKAQFTAINGGSTMKKREFLTPRSPDGKSGGEVVTANVQSEPNRVTQYAETQPYFGKNVDRTPLSSSPPETQAEANALETERRSLIGQLEAGTLNAEERATAAQRIQKIEEVLARWRNRQMHDQGHREQVR